MIQARKAERFRSFMSAQVMFNTAPAIDCLVKNFSPAGVRLEISDRTPLPNEFDLNIPHKGKMYYARVAWRGDGTVGAEFVEKADAASKNVSANEDDADKYDRVMRDNARLRMQVLQLQHRIAQLTGEA